MGLHVGEWVEVCTGEMLFHSRLKDDEKEGLVFQGPLPKGVSVNGTTLCLRQWPEIQLGQVLGAVKGSSHGNATDIDEDEQDKNSSSVAILRVRLNPPCVRFTPYAA